MSYKKMVQLAKHKHELSNEKRFVKISDREYRSDIPESAWKSLLQNNNLQTWKGMILAKGVSEITVYPMLMYELQPKTIIEIGAFNGGSAIWFADIAKALEIESYVYSTDIDLSLLDEKAKDHPRVNFIEGDSNHIESVLPPELLSTLPHPWFITEDAHVNSAGILEYFHNNGLESGDYIIIEDTNPLMWKRGIKDEKVIGAYDEDYPDQETLGERLMKELEGWLKNHEDEYLIDSYYLDMYGYNVSKNWNSVLKKV
ncbi:MAG: cephalosporin hydroxylase [Okeania sp. SIO2D1]|nr:cephalosporin hydroxylase [Okeania sp. SIO2D1]